MSSSTASSSSKSSSSTTTPTFISLLVLSAFASTALASPVPVAPNNGNSGPDSTVYDPSPADSHPHSTSTPSATSLRNGQIIGITIAILFLVAGSAVGAWFLMKMRREKKNREEEARGVVKVVEPEVEERTTSV